MTEVVILYVIVLWLRGHLMCFVILLYLFFMTTYKGMEDFSAQIGPADSWTFIELDYLDKIKRLDSLSGLISILIH